MKMKQIQVSEEYLDSLCEWMLEWVQKEDSYTISQFLQHKGIGYPYLKYFTYCSPKVSNTFEVVKSTLCNKWFEKGMSISNLPSHQSKILMRYLRLYDSHGLDVEEERKKEIIEAEKQAELNYLIEQYDREELDEPYRKIYEDNVDKRRDSKETE